jgi:hypothetical protein
VVGTEMLKEQDARRATAPFCNCQQTCAPDIEHEPFD